jgi:predicted metal-dependent phosphoesterase TrpH
MLKVDLHIHTTEDPVDQIGYDAFTLVDRAVAMGFDAVAITLHDRQLRLDALDWYARARGIVLVPGIERTILGKHVLLLNFPLEAQQVDSFEALASLKTAHPGGLVIAPHPFFPGGSPLRDRLEANASVFDAVEWSYFWTRALNFNARAAQWATAHGKPLVGNSDLHDIRQLGRTYSLVDAAPDPSAICEAVRAGRVEVVTSPVPYAELAAVFGGMAIRGRKEPELLKPWHPAAGARID